MIGKAQTKRLQERVDANRERRQRELESTRPYRERMREVNEAYQVVPRMDFWCDACAGFDESKGDIVAVGHKGVRAPSGHLPFAFYQGQCPKGHMVMRHITDKHRDPYYHKSIKMRRERAMAADDLLQPNDPRFRLVYPNQWAKMEAERKADEERAELEKYAREHRE